jgi:hypothetical protein
MMKHSKIASLGNILLIILYSTLILLIFHHKSEGQERPPRPIKVFVSPTQGLLFGAFSHGPSGGTLSVSPSGIRSASGSVIQLSLGYIFSPAIFQVEGIKGTVISITDNSSTAFTLTGSNGGTLTLHLGTPQTNTDCGTPFVLNAEAPLRMEVRIGGTLTVGNSGANPPGNYSGTFTVTFNQE